MTCPKCGTVAEAGTRFCGNCGGPLTPAGGISAGPTRMVQEAEAVTEVVPPPQVHAKPTTFEHPPANLLRAAPTVRASDMSQSVQAAVHALVPPVSQPPTQAMEPRVPVNMVSNLTGPRPTAPAEPLHPDTEANVKALSIWYQFYGSVGLVVGLVLFSAQPLNGTLGIVIGTVALVAGLMLYRCNGMGRMLSLLLALGALCAAGASFVPNLLPMGLWAAAAAIFSIMSLLLLTNARAAEVCTPKYQQRAEQSHHEVLNLGSPFFWVPGVVTGVVLIVQSVMH